MTMTPEQRTATLSALVAEEIRAWLGRRRMSQAQLARALGQSQMWVSDRLRGIQPISLDDMERIAHVLDVPVLKLLPPDGLSVRLSPVNRSADAAPAPARVHPPTGRTSPHVAAGVSPSAPQRRDSTRPQSAIPATKRRPTTVRSPGHPMAA